MDEAVGTEAGDVLRSQYSLGDAVDVVSIFERAGVEATTFETCAEVARFSSPRTMVGGDLRGWLPLFGINLTEDKIEEVLAQLGIPLAAYATESGEAALPTSAHITTAKKPN